MKNILQYIIVAMFFVTLTNCEDPATAFDPVNPNLTEEAVLGAPNSAKRLLAGCERQLAIVMNELVPLTEIASDNYQNTQTFYNQFLDKLEINYTDTDINALQFEIARLREMALSGIHEFGPVDAKYTEDQHAEFFFFVGVSYLLAAENFKSLPNQVGGVVVPAASHFAVAADNFRIGAETVIDDNFIKASCLLGRARAQYALNQKEGAKAAAFESLQLVPNFVRFVQYDMLKGLENSMQDAIADRGAFDDLQPLPRLDFLDPKFNQNEPGFDVNIPFLKAEEAFLILSEAAIAEDALQDARGFMARVVGIADGRPTAIFDDGVEDRTQAIPGSRPDQSIVRVAASTNALLRNGLVLDRKNGAVEIPTISGTSVTLDMIDMADNEEKALALLYLLRQEVFIAEGRRMSDLGIKLVVSELEQRTNANVNDMDVLAELPPFIANIKTELDAFNYNQMNNQVVIMHDLNAIIAANRASGFVCPFQ